MPAEKSSYSSREKSACGGNPTSPYSLADKLKKENAKDDSKNSPKKSDASQIRQATSPRSASVISPSNSGPSKDAHNLPKPQSPAKNSVASPRSQSANVKSPTSKALSQQSHGRSNSPSVNTKNAASSLRASERAGKSSASPAKERESVVKKTLDKIHKEICHHGQKIQHTFLDKHVTPRVKHTPITLESASKSPSRARSSQSPSPSSIPNKPINQSAGFIRRSPSPMLSANLNQSSQHGSRQSSASASGSVGGSPKKASSTGINKDLNSSTSPKIVSVNILSPKLQHLKSDVANSSSRSGSISPPPTAKSQKSAIAATSQVGAQKNSSSHDVQQHSQLSAASPKSMLSANINKIPPSSAASQKQSPVGDSRRPNLESASHSGPASRAHK